MTQSLYSLSYASHLTYHEYQCFHRCWLLIPGRNDAKTGWGESIHITWIIINLITMDEASKAFGLSLSLLLFFNFITSPTSGKQIVTWAETIKSSCLRNELQANEFCMWHNQSIQNLWWFDSLVPPTPSWIQWKNESKDNFKHWGVLLLPGINSHTLNTSGCIIMSQSQSNLYLKWSLGNQKHKSATQTSGLYQFQEAAIRQ